MALDAEYYTSDVTARPGDGIVHWASRLVSVADMIGGRAWGSFNDTRVRADKGDDARDVLDRWADARP